MCDTVIDCDDCRASTGGRCWKHPLSTGYNVPVADAPLDPAIGRKMLECDRDRERARAKAAEKERDEWRADAERASKRDLSSIQRAHAAWVKRNFPHMTENELMLAHAGGVAEEYFELGQAIGPLIRAGIKCVNQIKPEDWSKERVGDALADMLIFACQLAESFEIDLGEVVAGTAAEVQRRDWVRHREQTWRESTEALNAHDALKSQGEPEAEGKEASSAGQREYR